MGSRSNSEPLSPVTVPEALRRLDQRLSQRFSGQPNALDLLPSVDVDLHALTLQSIAAPPEEPLRRRADMVAQKQMLTKTFSGRSELELLHALAISYLRRNTPHTTKAWKIFRRIWAEQSEFMTNELTPRWLISALQTFYDHSDDAHERIAGGVGFLYGNLIKVYETEYAARRRNRLPELKNYKNKSVPGLFSFKPGDDILININILVLDAAKSGGLAAKPLMALLEVIASSETIFQRTDALYGIEPFTQHPSFTMSFQGRIK
jgi:hypothetical protein